MSLLPHLFCIFTNSLSSGIVIDKTIQRIASGDTRALDKLYKELKPAFVAFFREHFNMDADSVQDLYQETMAAVYNNIITGRLKEDSLGRTKLSTYATQVGKYIHMSSSSPPATPA